MLRGAQGNRDGAIVAGEEGIHHRDTEVTEETRKKSNGSRTLSFVNAAFPNRSAFLCDLSASVVNLFEGSILKGSGMGRALVFCGILIFHWISQFLAWTYAEHNALMRLLWNILATPLIHAAGSYNNQYFWVVASLNSLLWAAVLTYFVTRFALKH